MLSYVFYNVNKSIITHSKIVSSIGSMVNYISWHLSKHSIIVIIFHIHYHSDVCSMQNVYITFYLFISLLFIKDTLVWSKAIFKTLT